MSFARAIAYVLRPDVEGRLVDDPDDQGGLTNCGYSLRAHPEMTADEIRALTPATVAPLYQRDYWQPIHGDELPDATAFALFDFAVNSGVPKAIRLLQAALRIPVDGDMGPQTVHAAQIAPPKTLVRDLYEQRLALMKAQPNYAHEARGWRRRVIQTAIEAFQ
jgi:lysozyme family protein